MIVLGIESSCDETAAALVNDKREILGQALLSQEEHHAFGGVIPEVAARAHLEHIDEIIQSALQDAGLGFDDIDAIAAASGPGLIGGVVVGVMAAKALSLALNKPFIAVNHLEGHALTVRLSSDVQFPYLLLLTSGGHCQVLIVKGVGQYERLGGTIDDSAGEAFDKVAKMLDIGYPGGPNLEKRAALGDPKKYDFPVPMKGRKDCDFSFSGLKTAVRVAIEKKGNLSEQDKNDMCAAFQYSVVSEMQDRLKHAISVFKEKYPDAKDMVVAGGVAANKSVRKMIEDLAQKNGLIFSAPPIGLCTDNGVMIAWAGLERFRLGHKDNFDFRARPRWPLDTL